MLSIMKIFILCVSLEQLSLVMSHIESNSMYIISHPELLTKYNLNSGWQRPIDFHRTSTQLCNLVREATIFMPSDTTFAGSDWLSEVKYHRGHESLTDEEENGVTTLTNFGERVIDLTKKISHEMPRDLYNIRNINSLSCKIGSSVVYLTKNLNFKDGFILFHKNRTTFFSVVVKPLAIYPPNIYTYNSDVVKAFHEIIDAKEKNYILNEVEASLFSRTWLDKAQLCVWLILSKNDLRYRNVELQISKKQIDQYSLVLLKTPITVLHCEAEVKDSNYGLPKCYIFPHPEHKNKLFILHSFAVNPVELYRVLDSRY